MKIQKDENLFICTNFHQEDGLGVEFMAN